MRNPLDHADPVDNWQPTMLKFHKESDLHLPHFSKLSIGDLCIGFFWHANHIRDEPLIMVGGGVLGKIEKKKGREADQKKKKGKEKR